MLGGSGRYEYGLKDREGEAGEKVKMLDSLLLNE